MRIPFEIVLIVLILVEDLVLELVHSLGGLVVFEPILIPQTYGHECVGAPATGGTAREVEVRDRLIRSDTSTRAMSNTVVSARASQKSQRACGSTSWPQTLQTDVPLAERKTSRERRTPVIQTSVPAIERQLLALELAGREDARSRAAILPVRS